jgi:hypothetical protein
MGKKPVMALAGLCLASTAFIGCGDRQEIRQPPVGRYQVPPAWPQTPPAQIPPSTPLSSLGQQGMPGTPVGGMSQPPLGGGQPQPFGNTLPPSGSGVSPLSGIEGNGGGPSRPLGSGEGLSPHGSLPPSRVGMDDMSMPPPPPPPSGSVQRSGFGAPLMPAGPGAYPGPASPAMLEPPPPITADRTGSQLGTRQLGVPSLPGNPAVMPPSLQGDVP